MTYSACDIEAKLDQLARIMAVREDRMVYLSLYQRLEEELANLKSQESDIDRILRRAASSGPGALIIAA